MLPPSPPKNRAPQVNNWPISIFLFESSPPKQALFPIFSKIRGNYAKSDRGSLPWVCNLSTWWSNLCCILWHFFPLLLTETQNDELRFVSKQHLQQHDVLLWPCKLVLKAVGSQSKASQASLLLRATLRLPRMWTSCITCSQVYACKPISFQRKTSSTACRFMIYTHVHTCHSSGIDFDFQFEGQRLNESTSTNISAVFHAEFKHLPFCSFPPGEPLADFVGRKSLLIYLNNCAWWDALFLIPIRTLELSFRKLKCGFAQRRRHKFAGCWNSNASRFKRWLC